MAKPAAPEAAAPPPRPVATGVPGFTVTVSRSPSATLSATVASTSVAAVADLRPAAPVKVTVGGCFGSVPARLAQVTPTGAVSGAASV